MADTPEGTTTYARTVKAEGVLEVSVLVDDEHADDEHGFPSTLVSPLSTDVSVLPSTNDAGTRNRGSGNPPGLPQPSFIDRGKTVPPGRSAQLEVAARGRRVYGVSTVPRCRGYALTAQRCATPINAERTRRRAVWEESADGMRTAACLNRGGRGRIACDLQIRGEREIRS